MRRPRWMLAVATILMAIGSGLVGCTSAPEVRYIQEPLALPPRPVLPRLSADDVQCLTDDAYRRLVARDIGRRQYAEQLEAIIQSTHGATDGR